MNLKIKVPATSANLGAGFDCFGIALSLYNTFEVDKVMPVGIYRVEIAGYGENELSEKNNLFIDSYRAASREWGIEPFGISLKMRNQIPMGRGLGSSSSAIVGGVLAANELRKLHGKNPLEKSELLTMMTKIEGHPDNVVPCCIGGLVVGSWASEEEKLCFIKMPPGAARLRAVLIVPDKELKTSKARQALPKNVPLTHAVFNIGRASLFVASWMGGNFEELGFAMEDRLHQSYRAKLIPGCQEILTQANAISGCFGVAISGAGSGVIAFSDEENSKNVGEQIQKIFESVGSKSKIFILKEDANGAAFI